VAAWSRLAGFARLPVFRAIDFDRQRAKALSPTGPANRWLI